MAEKILVTGATGNVGGAVVANLTDSGTNVRALVRDAAKAQGLRDTGVEVVSGDLEKPETLDAVFSGVDKVFLVTPVGPDAVAQARNGIAAAKRAGNPHIVRQSAIAATDESSRIGRQHAEIDAELKGSGLPYTILRPHFFMQNTMMSAQSVASDGVVYMAVKDGRIGMIDFRDIAEVAAKVLTSDGHEGKTYTLTGPASITFDDVAATLSRALGKEVKYVDLPLEASREAMLGMGLPEWTADAFNEIWKSFSEGAGDVTTHDAEEITGHHPRSYETFAREFAQAFSGAPAEGA